MRTTAMVKILAVIALLAGTAGAGVKYVAVVETDVDAQSGAAAEINPAEVRQITAELRRQATENLPAGRYSVMTSETVQAMGGAVLEECAEENCVIALGSKIGADYIVRGTISKFQTRFTLSVELYETENGTLIVTSEPVRSENIGDLLDKASGACANMYKKFADTRRSVDAPPAALPAAEPQYAGGTQTAGQAPAAAVSGGGKTAGNAGEGRKYDYYVAPKYVADVPYMLTGGEVEVGLVWGKGWFAGGVFGYGNGTKEDDGLEWVGGGISLGNAVNLGNQLQLLYGGTAGFWLREYVGEYDYTDNRWETIEYFNFFGPIVKLRWNFIELTYRGLLAINEVWLGNLFMVWDDDYSGKAVNWGHQIMIGIYFETSKRAR